MNERQFGADITGQRFGRLIVVRFHMPGRKHPRRIATWLCQCDCGGSTLATKVNLKSGNTRSCGCLKQEILTKHGACVGYKISGTYRSWQHMHERCRNPNQEGYKHWGGRGISVCDRWQSFENFLADMGERPAGYSIERIDNDGNYEPSNCKWIPRNEQMQNQRRPSGARKATSPAKPRSRRTTRVSRAATAAPRTERASPARKPRRLQAEE